MDFEHAVEGGKLGIGMSDYDKRVEELEQILAQVMKNVDLWLKGPDFDKDEVGRAKLMRDRVVELLMEKDRTIKDLQCRLDRSDKMLDAALFLVGKTYGE